MPTITLTRQQLYDRAWSTPIETLAQELGLSGRGLGKLCDRHDAPVPPRGWWAKKAAGHRVKQAPLPNSDVPADRRIQFNGPAAAMAEAADDPSVQPLIEFEQRTENRVTVLDDLPVTHPLLVKTQKALNRAKRDASGLVVPPGGLLHIQTSRPLHDRAL
jgi:hypothetical protein